MQRTGWQGLQNRRVPDNFRVGSRLSRAFAGFFYRPGIGSLCEKPPARSRSVFFQSEGEIEGIGIPDFAADLRDRVVGLEQKLVRPRHPLSLRPIRITPVACVMSATCPKPMRSDRAYRDEIGKEETIRLRAYPDNSFCTKFLRSGTSWGWLKNLDTVCLSHSGKKWKSSCPSGSTPTGLGEDAPGVRTRTVPTPYSFFCAPAASGPLWMTRVCAPTAPRTTGSNNGYARGFGNGYGR